MSSESTTAAAESSVSEERFRGQHDLQQAVESIREPYVRRLVEETPAGATPQSSFTIPRQMEERRTPIEISYMQPLCLLDDEISPTLVAAFQNQARSKPTLITREVITGIARMRVRLALTGDPQQTFVRADQIYEWWNHVNIHDASEIVARYFLQTEAGFDIPIAEVMNKILLRYNLAKESVEDETFIRMELALQRYFETHAQENSTTLNELALIIERKLPKNSQLQADYMSKKLQELGNSTEDTPFLVIQRIKKCLGHVRNLKKSIDRYGLYDLEYNAEAAINTPTPQSDRVKLVAPSTKQERGGKIACHTCGIVGHSTDTCFFRNHQDVNHSLAPWHDSAIGERWRAFGYATFKAGVTLPGKEAHTAVQSEGSVDSMGHAPQVHFETSEQPIRNPRTSQYNKKREYPDRRFQGGSGPAPRYQSQYIPTMYGPPGGYPPYGGQFPPQYQYPPQYPPYQGQGENNTPFTGPYGAPGKNQKGSHSGEYGTCSTTLATITTLTPDDDYLPIRVFLIQQMPRKPAEARNHIVATKAPDDSVTGKALIDTGSLGGDFLSGDMISRLHGEKFVYRTSTATVVCSGLDNACYPTTEMIDVGIEFSTDEKIKKIIYLKCRIFHLSKIDLIIGRPSIKKYGFSRLNSSHFGTDISDKPASEQKTILSRNPLKRKINNRPSWVTTSTDTPVDKLSTVDTQSTLISTDNTNPTQGCITTSRTRETPTCACHHCSENMHWAGDDTSEEVHR
jgi:hypothetical protein